MRSAFIISLAVHLALGFISIRLVRISQVRFVPREVYAVRLVSLPQGGGPLKDEMKAPAKEVPQLPPAKPEEKKPDELVTPAKETKSKKTGDSRKTVPSSRIDKPSPPSADTATGTGEGPGLGGVSTGDMALDVGDFPFAYYLATVKRKIATNWRVPGGAGGMTNCRVYFRIRRSGSIESPAVEASSGNFLFDQAALRAVVEANPLPALPGGFGDEYLGVHFSFAYEEE
jgi:TonB family protein